jgi:hypothetical protein
LLNGDRVSEDSNKSYEGKEADNEYNPISCGSARRFTDVGFF